MESGHFTWLLWLTLTCLSMYCLSDGQELELLLDELDKELMLLLLEDDKELLLEEADVLVLVDVEDGVSVKESLLEKWLLKVEVALLDGMQPTTSNDMATGTSNIFFLIAKQLLDLF